MKVCRVCKESKPLTEYHSAKTNRDRLKTECRECVSVRNQKYKHTKQTPENRYRDKLGHIRRTYGLSAEQYEELSATQSACAICGKVFTDTFDKQLDHCHETGRIRKFLCQKCNKALGLFNDNPELLRLAALYIEEN
jgi:hypothetical protein